MRRSTLLRPSSLLLLAWACTLLFSAGFARAQRLVNLSTRTQVGTGLGAPVVGFVIEGAPGTTKDILLRAVGPTLAEAPFSVPGTLTDPRIELYDSTGRTLASNDNWSATADAGAALASNFAGVGAFGLKAGSRDAALLATRLAPGAYTAQVTGTGSAPTGIVLLEVYDVTGDARLVNLSTRAQVATGAGILISGLVISPGSGARRLLLRAAGPTLGTFPGIGGALADPTLSVLDANGSTVAANDNWDASTAAGVAAAFTQAGAFPFIAGSRDAALVTSLPPGGYTVQVSGVGGTTGLALLEAYDLTVESSATVYLATLRPTVAGTTAFGRATVRLAEDGKSALVSATFTNLSSPETVAYLRYGGPGETGIEVLRLTYGQVSDQRWTFTGSAAFSPADLAQALREGRIFLSVETVTHPTGELRGALLPATGSFTFTPPAAPPSLPSANLTAAEAARFLTQATFGPKPAEIDALTGKTQSDLDAWITAQMTLPASLHYAATAADHATYDEPLVPNPPATPDSRQRAWWTIVVNGPDQLRQRVAFALSELFVVSDDHPVLNGPSLPLANFYDLLVRHAFGDFRTLLEEVTRNPVMGIYLSHLGNSKARVDPVTGRVLSYPDENYAREVMQLFTIGLYQLQPDGTLRLDALGAPIPTYDQTTVSEMARIFTGWSTRPTETPNFITGSGDNVNPMIVYPDYHDDGAKVIIDGLRIPAGQGGDRDLALTLDALFRHENTGPFLARQLIQRLVTANPSPGYIYRVAKRFADNGTGRRGDLGAVVRAVLTDYEARAPAVAAAPGFGKLKEPLLRVTALLRAFGGASTSGSFGLAGGFSYETYPEVLSNPLAWLPQAALHAPSVFNFFTPDYVHPGPLAANGLVAPEFQILTELTAVTGLNAIESIIYSTPVGGPYDPITVTLNFDSALLALAADPRALAARINLLVASGNLSPATVGVITDTLAALPSGGAYADLTRVRTAIYLAAVSPEGAVQK